ncbi:hypothetical protein NDU88_006363 [Pleurodeles waltl]|uniref:Uncharacterized protein n=1 Tax=Pleurodeles waltl TaxID=8319 RepID=A0AAV7N3U1_PLEWA|nr:hypothetical protein NDU88_006363 [Pleurodeles waltl]
MELLNRTTTDQRRSRVTSSVSLAGGFGATSGVLAGDELSVGRINSKRMIQAFSVGVDCYVSSPDSSQDQTLLQKPGDCKTRNYQD